MALTQEGEKCMRPAVKEASVHMNPEAGGDTSWVRVTLCEMHLYCLDGRIEHWPRYQEAVAKLRQQEFRI